MKQIILSENDARSYEPHEITDLLKRCGSTIAQKEHSLLHLDGPFIILARQATLPHSNITRPIEPDWLELNWWHNTIMKTLFSPRHPQPTYRAIKRCKRN